MTGPGPMFCLVVFRGHLGGVPRLESEEFLHSHEKKTKPQNTCPLKPDHLKRKFIVIHLPPKRGKMKHVAQWQLIQFFFPPRNDQWSDESPKNRTQVGVIG